MKIRSMACLIKKPVEFKERVLSNQVQKGRFINGHVIKENGQLKENKPRSIT